VTRGAYQDQATRRARLGVERNGVSIDDQIPNAVGAEDRQEFLEVVEHPGPGASWREPHS